MILSRISSLSGLHSAHVGERERGSLDRHVRCRGKLFPVGPDARLYLGIGFRILEALGFNRVVLACARGQSQAIGQLGIGERRIGLDGEPVRRSCLLELACPQEEPRHGSDARAAAGPVA